ncbi:MAG: FecR domain-containing protein, partial [Paludibacteraceae bacterium]|nr:FecR domain-containing protein [Paludibacteraceae bacterium]
MQKYLRGEASDQERLELLAQLQRDEQIGHWLRADMEFSDSMMPQPVQERILRNILAEQKKTIPLRNPLRLWLAACGVVIIILSALCGVLLWQRTLPAMPAVTPNADIIVCTHLGEHSHVILPDGTAVTLNAQTTVRYATAMTDGIRRVQVDGEAFFDVAKDAAHPFVVTAG